MEKAQTLGKTIEDAKKDTLLLGGEKTSSLQEKSDVHHIKKTSAASNTRKKNCFRCGRDDHLTNDHSCMNVAVWFGVALMLQTLIR